MDRTKTVTFLEKSLSLNFDDSKIFDMTMKELGISSLNFVKFIVEVETEFDFEFNEDELVSLYVIKMRGVIDLINSKIFIIS